MSYISNTERVAKIREKLKSEFPNYKFSITKEGNGVRIRILEAPVNYFEGQPDKQYIQVNNYYISSSWEGQARTDLMRINEIASEGVRYYETGDYGNQPDFYVWISIGGYDKPFVYKPPTRSTSSTSSGGRKPFTRGTTTTNYDKGALVFECDSGWKVYKKTLPDNRIVYNAIKDKDVASNKNDWNAIKGEVYVEAGFKWGRFGAFERWGEIDDESNVLTNLCAVLSKYYKKTSQSTPATQTPTPTTTTDVSSPQPAQPEPPQPQGDVEQETRKLLRSLELIRGDGTNQEIEQLIRALRLILK